jgi:hypothetical protein
MEKQIEEMARIICADSANKGLCEKCGFNKGCWKFKDAEAIYNAGYRKQSEGENEYKKLYEQLLDDFEHALHFAGKNNNVCNFCEHDCGEGGTCKGRENWIECNPKWRGIMKGGAE